MKKKQAFFLLLVLQLFTPSLYAQIYFWKKITLKKPYPDSLLLDSFSIPDDKWHVDANGKKIAKTCFFLNRNTRVLYIDTACVSPYDSLSIYWLSLPIDLSQTLYHKDTAIIHKQSSSILLLPSEKLFKQQTSFFETGSLEKSGSFSRSISIGNKQDVGMTSSLNLQLRGQLTSDVEIEATISDNQLPIQPEGTTQQIQQIDRMLIQLKSKHVSITAGDIELTSTTSRFLKYSRKVQGFQFLGNTRRIALPQDSLSYSLGFSYTRGKFAVMTIQPIEGNQGPYMLRGNDNEQYIMVLAGTERVYLDGQLLTRGYDNDYIINYNTAEIIFTNKIFIRSNSRIVVEFQYMDRFYGRSILTSQFSYHLSKKWKLALSTFEEKDAKNQPLEPLSDSARFALFNAGDNLENAYLLSIRDVGYRSDVILYAIKDSMGYDSVFYYSTNPDSARYLIYFTYVGENKGHYIPAASLANGKVYKWVAPQNGIPQGSYAPIVKLVAPQKKKLISIQNTFNVGSNISIETEYAHSQKDNNTFSPFNDNDNNSHAIYFSIKQKINLPSKHDTSANIENIVRTEWVDARFNPIERFLPIEFERDWALPKFNLPYKTLSFSSTYKAKKTQLGFNESLVQMYPGILSSRSMVFSQVTYSRFGLMQTTALTYPIMEHHGSFLQYQNQTWWMILKLRMDLAYRGEVRWNNVSSADSTAFRWNEIVYSVQNPDSAKWLAKPYYKFRLDEKKKQFGFAKEREEHDIGFMLTLKRSPACQWQQLVSYHWLPTRSDTTILPRFLIIRSTYHQSFWKNLLTIVSQYENRIGRENKKEYFFLEVSPGGGTHTWIDFNNNGIKELNEFVVAQFKDQANYIKLLMPTNIYQNAFESLLSADLAFDASQLHTRSWLKGFKNKFTINLSNKNISSIVWRHYIPLQQYDSLVINSTSFLRNVLSYRTKSGKWYAQYQFQQNSSRQNYTYGTDEQFLKQHEISSNLTLPYSFMIESSISAKNKIFNSEAAKTSSYNATTYGALTRFSYQFKSTWRASLAFSHEETQNYLDSTSISKNAITTEYRHSLQAQGIASFKFSFLLYYNVSKPLNSYLEYVLLEGYKPGKNFSWEIMLSRRIQQNIEISFLYQGRALPGETVVHSGSAQVRVLF